MDLTFLLLTLAVGLVAGLSLAFVLAENFYAYRFIENYSLNVAKGEFHLNLSGNRNWVAKIGDIEFVAQKWKDENKWTNILRQEGKTIQLFWASSDQKKGLNCIIGWEAVDPTNASV